MKHSRKSRKFLRIFSIHCIKKNKHWEWLVPIEGSQTEFANTSLLSAWAYWIQLSQCIAILLASWWTSPTFLATLMMITMWDEKHLVVSDSRNRRQCRWIVKKFVACFFLLIRTSCLRSAQLYHGKELRSGFTCNRLACRRCWNLLSQSYCYRSGLRQRALVHIVE